MGSLFDRRLKESEDKGLDLATLMWLLLLCFIIHHSVCSEWDGNGCVCLPCRFHFLCRLSHFHTGTPWEESVRTGKPQTSDLSSVGWCFVLREFRTSALSFMQTFISLG